MKNVFLALCCGVALFACNKPKEETTTPAADPAPPPQAEIGDPKYAEIGKKGLQQLSSGDIDGWMTSFADSARYLWSAGDSLIGKKAITAYWKERRGKMIESISFTNDIWTPLKINTPQKGPDRAGVWLLSWHQVNVTYKNHQSLKFWVHTDYHFDASDKIDVAVQYIDRAPIVAALAKK
jgi:hypothetical protein